jgi:hypothetical protein
MPFKLAVPFRKRTVSTTSVSPSVNVPTTRPDRDRRPSINEPHRRTGIEDGWDDAGFEIESRNAEWPVSRVQLGIPTTGGASTSALSLPLTDSGDSLAPKTRNGRGRSMSPLGLHPITADNSSPKSTKSSFSLRSLFKKDKSKAAARKKPPLDSRPASTAYSSTSSASSPASPTRAGPGYIPSATRSKSDQVGRNNTAYGTSPPTSTFEPLSRLNSAASGTISVSQFRQARAARSSVSLHSIDGCGPSTPRLELPLPRLPKGDAPRPPLVRMSMASQSSLESNQMVFHSPDELNQDDYFGTPRPSFAAQPQHDRRGSTSSVASNGGPVASRPSVEHNRPTKTRQIIHIQARKPETLTPSSFNAQGWKAAGHESDGSSDDDHDDEHSSTEENEKAVDQGAKNRRAFSSARRPSAPAVLFSTTQDIHQPSSSKASDGLEELDGDAIERHERSRSPGLGKTFENVGDGGYNNNNNDDDDDEDDVPLSRLSMRPSSRADSPLAASRDSSSVYPLGGLRAAATTPSLSVNRSSMLIPSSAASNQLGLPQPVRGHATSLSLSPNFSPSSSSSVQSTKPRVSSNLASNAPTSSSPARSLFTPSASSSEISVAAAAAVPKPRRSYPPEPSIASLAELEQNAMGGTGGSQKISPESSTMTDMSGRSNSMTTPASLVDMGNYGIGIGVGKKPNLMSVMVENEQRKASLAAAARQEPSMTVPSGYAYGAAVVNGASSSGSRSRKTSFADTTYGAPPSGSRSRTTSFAGSARGGLSRPPSSLSLAPPKNPAASSRVSDSGKSTGGEARAESSKGGGDDVFARMKERHKAEAKKAINLGNELNGVDDGGPEEQQRLPMGSFGAGYGMPWNNPYGGFSPGGSPQMGGYGGGGLQSMPPPPGVDAQLYAMLPPDQKYQLQQRGAMLMNMMAQAAAQAHMQAQWSASQMGSVHGGGSVIGGAGGGGGDGGGSVIGGPSMSMSPNMMMGPPMGMSMSPWNQPPPFMMGMGPATPQAAHFFNPAANVFGGSSTIGFPSSASAIGSPSPPLVSAQSSPVVHPHQQQQQQYQQQPQRRGPASEVDGGRIRRNSRFLTREV